MWERLHCNKCKAVKLKKFMGRPKDHSPKARILHLMGYKLPFDRHDWVVDRCGQDIRQGRSPSFAAQTSVPLKHVHASRTA